MALTYLLDTDVISETAKPKPSERVLAFVATCEEICLSAVTVYELSRGVARLKSGKRRQFLDAWLAELLAGRTRTLPFDRLAALAATDIEAEARRQGRAIETRDLFILATAKASGLGVASRNETHFSGFGVVVLDPFVE
jgi:predicted nucleic acid-binding protein